MLSDSWLYFTVPRQPYLPMEPPCLLHHCRMERLWSLALKLQTHSKSFISYDHMVWLITVFMFSGRHQTTITGHGVWSHDAHVVMQDVSHMKLITMSLLQTCSYITNQMHTPVMIDVNKFMESFSIKSDGRNVHPPSWSAGEEDSVTFFPSSGLIPDSQSSSLTPPRPFTMEDYSRCRRAEAIHWINLQEKRTSIIPRLWPITPEEYQEWWDGNDPSRPFLKILLCFYLFWEQYQRSPNFFFCYKNLQYRIVQISRSTFNEKIYPCWEIMWLCEKVNDRIQRFKNLTWLMPNKSQEKHVTVWKNQR